MLIFNSKIYQEEKQIFFLRKSIQDIKVYLERLKKETKSRNAYKLKKSFYNKINQISRGLLNNSNIRLNLMRKDALEYLQLNFNELENIYNQIIKEEEKTGKKLAKEDIGIYSSNIEENKVNVIKENLVLLRETLEKANGFEDKTMLIKLSNMSKKERDIVLKGLEAQMGSEVRKDIEKRIKIFRTPEFDLLKDYMRYVLSAYKDKLKEQYISSLVFIGKFLKEFNLLKNYIDSNNSNIQKFQLETMRCNEKELEKIFTEEYLKTLSIEKLTYLNVYWLNRFSKEMDNISKAAFVITDFDLWEEIFQGEETDITDEELKWELYKIETLTNFEMQCLEENEDNEVLKEAIEKAKQDENFKNDIIEKSVVKLDFSRYIKQTETDEGFKYKTFFEQKLPRSKNIFTHEIEYFKSVYNSIRNAYKLKDNALMGILDNLQLNSSIINWGIMRQADDNKLLNGRYVLIGMDLVGMNMPIRLHIPKDLLIDCVAKNTKINTIPLYAGCEDFHVHFGNDESHSKSIWITSPILMPVTEQQKEYTEKELENNSNKLNNHLAYVYGVTDIPEHLKTEIVKYKKGKKIVKKEFKRQYVKVETGEIIDEDTLDKMKNSKKGEEER